MLMRASSPACQQSVAILKQIYDETSRGDLRILAVKEPPASLDAFVRRTGANFRGQQPCCQLNPTAMCNRSLFHFGFRWHHRKILIGPQSLNTLRSTLPNRKEKNSLQLLQRVLHHPAMLGQCCSGGVGIHLAQSHDDAHGSVA